MAWFHVQHVQTSVLLYSGTYGHLSNGIDKRIYIGKQAGGGKQNSVIDFPDLKGSACGFCKKCLRMDTTQWYTRSLANIPDFYLGPLQPCWPLENSQLAVCSKRLEVYPNPASTISYQCERKRRNYLCFRAIIFTKQMNAM